MHTDDRTIANVFADAGYATGMVGKWHLGDNAPHRPQDRGFKDVVRHRCEGVGQAPDLWGNDRKITSGLKRFLFGLRHLQKSG